MLSHYTHLFCATGAIAIASAAFAISCPVAATADTFAPADYQAVNVTPVPGVNADTIRGVDISSLLAEEASGVTFFDTAGKPADPVTVLSQHGVNWARIRVWVDPHTAAGKGYGGGTNDLATAMTLGKRATDANMRVLIDFHYSDFWADPGKQRAPKQWQGLTPDEIADRVYHYTCDSLSKLQSGGVDVGMVQVGNETNSGIAGVTGMANMAHVFSAGARAVRETIPTAKVAVHFTNPERGNYPDIAAQLEHYHVDYDVFASSYYPYWHGSYKNLTSMLSTIAQKYGKDVMVAETAWPYTLDDGDGHPNVISESSALSDYPVSPQGQATAVREVFAAVAAVPKGAGLGVFYWEPAWIPVGPASDLAHNKYLWETYGSGWAASYAAEYDPDDAGKWFGGSAWDNQTLFDHTGHPLPSLSVFKDVVPRAPSEPSASPTSSAPPVSEGNSTSKTSAPSFSTETNEVLGDNSRHNAATSSPEQSPSATNSAMPRTGVSLAWIGAALALLVVGFSLTRVRASHHE